MPPVADDAAKSDEPTKHEEITEDDVPIEISPAADGGSGEESGGALEVPSETMMLFCIMGSSVVLFIAAARYCDELKDSNGNDKDCEKEDALAVAVGVISFFTVVIHTALACFKPTQGYHNASKPVIAVLLFMWWTMGAGAGTFESPFKSTSNGYFAEWAGFFCSLYYMVLTVPPLKRFFVGEENKMPDSSEQKYAAMIGTFNVIEVLATLVECGDKNDCDEEYGYAILAGLISLVIAVIYIPCHSRMKSRACGPCPLPAIVGYFLVVWWCAAAGTFTFDKPFVATGNGFFASWGSLICSIFFAMEAAGHKVAIASDESADTTSTAPPSDSVANADTEVTAETGSAPDPDLTDKAPSNTGDSA